MKIASRTTAGRGTGGGRKHKKLWISFLLTFFLTLVGMSAQPGWAFAKNPAPPPPLASTKVVFAKKTLILGKQTLKVEIADTEEKSAQGLMFRKQLPEGEGMIFIFAEEEPRSFWMKNTFIPLSIGFFDSQKKLVEYFDMEPTKSEMDLSPPSYSSKKAAKYALEVPKGWFQKHKIPIGTSFELK